MNVAAGYAGDPAKVQIDRRSDEPEIIGLSGDVAGRRVGKEMVDSKPMNVDAVTEQCLAESRKEAR